MPHETANRFLPSHLAKLTLKPAPFFQGGRGMKRAASRIETSETCCLTAAHVQSAHAFYWERHREAAAASEADRLSGRDRAARVAGRPPILFAPAGRADFAGQSHADQGSRRKAECLSR